MTDAPKKRAGWTEERRAKFQATKQKQTEENLAKYGTKMAPESKEKFLKSREESTVQRRDNSKAHAYLPELQQWLLSLTRAMENSELFDALVQEYPEMNIRWDHHHTKILFSFSTNSLRPRYGNLAEQMFRRLFVCYQPGGYAREQGEGYASVWHLSTEALDAWLIKSLTKTFSVSKAFKVLMNFEPLTRAATEYVEVTNGFTLAELKGVKKKVMTYTERKEILEKRVEQQAGVNERNRKAMEGWVKKEAA
jgi:hypothetical protein